VVDGVLPAQSPATLTELARRVAAGGLDPHVRSVFSFDRAGEALRTVESGHALGKVVLAVRSDASGGAPGPRVGAVVVE
jgi:NADPH:quinone reductase-like Zn-dependent oxidoreductase